MVPTDEAMITRQMLYSGVLLPATATAAFAIPSSVSLQYFSRTHIRICCTPTSQRTNPPWSRLLLLQNCADRQCRPGDDGKVPLPQGKARHKQCDGMGPGPEADFGRRAAHVPAIQRYFRSRRCRAEIALYLFFCFLRQIAVRGGGRRGRFRRVRRYQRVQLLSRLALVILVVHREAAFLSFGVEGFSLGQRNASGISRFDGASDTERRLVVFLHEQGTHQRHVCSGTAIGVESKLFAILRDAVVVVRGRGSSHRIQNRDPYCVFQRRGVREYDRQQETRLQSCDPTDTHQANSSKHRGCIRRVADFPERFCRPLSQLPYILLPVAGLAQWLFRLRKVWDDRLTRGPSPEWSPSPFLW